MPGTHQVEKVWACTGVIHAMYHVRRDTIWWNASTYMQALVSIFPQVWAEPFYSLNYARKDTMLCIFFVEYCTIFCFGPNEASERTPMHLCMVTPISPRRHAPTPSIAQTRVRANHVSCHAAVLCTSPSRHVVDAFFKRLHTCALLSKH